MIRKSTWSAVILLVLVTAAFLIFRDREARQTPAAETTTAPQFVFSPASDGLVMGMTVEGVDGRTVVFDRGESGSWSISQPAGLEADPTLAESAASQAAALRILNKLDPATDPVATGLDSPSAVIRVRFSSGNERNLQVGSLTPTGSGYYTKSADNLYVVSKSSLDSLLSLLDFPPAVSLPGTPEQNGEPAPTGTTP